jgi:transcriptional regulator with XRE-family HTH domain
MKGGLEMQTFSTKNLAKTVKQLREDKGLTKEQLGNLTGINRIMIGRIEREEFIPSIVQLEALSSTLGFNLADMFVQKEKTNSFVALRSEILSDSEKEGVDKLLSMMLSLRQQIILRSLFVNGTSEA